MDNSGTHLNHYHRIVAGYRAWYDANFGPLDLSSFMGLDMPNPFSYNPFKDGDIVLLREYLDEGLCKCVGIGENLIWSVCIPDKFLSLTGP